MEVFVSWTLIKYSSRFRIWEKLGSAALELILPRAVNDPPTGPTTPYKIERPLLCSVLPLSPEHKYSLLQDWNRISCGYVRQKHGLVIMRNVCRTVCRCNVKHTLQHARKCEDARKSPITKRERLLYMVSISFFILRRCRLV